MQMGVFSHPPTYNMVSLTELLVQQPERKEYCLDHVILVCGHVTHEGRGKVVLESPELRLLELRGVLLSLPAFCGPEMAGTRRVVAPLPSVCSLMEPLADARESSSSSVSEPSPATTPGTGLPPVEDEAS